MELGDVLIPEAVVFLSGRTKEGAFRELAAAFESSYGSPDAQAVFDSITERERALSTWVAPGIAIPHAIFENQTRTRLVLGLSRLGVDYDAPDRTAVGVLVLIVGPGREHLRVLRQVALRLSAPGLTHSLSAAESSEAAYLAFTSAGGGDTGRPARLSEPLVRHAIDLARETGAKAVFVHTDASMGIERLSESTDVPVVLVTTSGFEELASLVDAARLVQLPFRGLSRSSQVELSVIFALSRGLVSREDRIVSVLGSPGSAVLDTVQVTDVGHEYTSLLAPRFGQDELSGQVLLRLLEIANELAEEGREGKPCGTIFVVGDYDAVVHHCQQMIVNPFAGHGERNRNVLDPSLKETIKEFAKIDGAFVVRDDGVLMSAGTYIRTRLPLGDLPPGLGARHAAATAITAVTGAVSIALSESTRSISIYKAGQRVMVL